MPLNLSKPERVRGLRMTRDRILEQERSQFINGEYGYASGNNDAAFKLTGILLAETGFNAREREIARELFERSLVYQLHFGGFDWRQNQY